jgi:hypothetical protein
MVCRRVETEEDKELRGRRIEEEEDERSERQRGKEGRQS